MFYFVSSAFLNFKTDFGCPFWPIFSDNTAVVQAWAESWVFRNVLCVMKTLSWRSSELERLIFLSGRGSPCQKREKPRGGWKVCYWYVHIYIQSLMSWTERESKTVVEYHVELFATYMVSTRCVGFTKPPLPVKLVPQIAFVHVIKY